MCVYMLVYMCIWGGVCVLLWVNHSEAVMQEACSDQTFSLGCNYAFSFQSVKF